MDPSAKNMEQPKYPKWSDVEKIYEQNEAINKVLTKLGILKKENPEHPAIKEQKKINEDTKNNLEDLNNSEDISETILNEIEKIYLKLKKDPNNKKLLRKAERLEEQYYKKTWFGVPFDRNFKIIADDDR